MRILLAIDRSEPALRARDLVASLAWPPGTTIRVISVVSEMAVAYGGDVEEHVRAFLEEAAAPLAGVGRTVEREVLIGRPASVTVEQSSGSDLVVVGSHRRGGLGERLLGSTSAEVVAQATVPVLVARTPSVSRLVVADDGSAGAEAAARCVALARAAFAGSPVHVVSVVDPEDPAIGSAARRTTDDIRGEHEERARRRADMLEASGFADVSVEVPEGHPADVIVGLSEDLGADLIAMGRYGRTGLRRILAGGVAWAVLHRARASVLIASAPPAPAT